MSAEEAAEKANPLSVFKGLGSAIRWSIGLSVNDNAIPCGAKNRDHDDNQINRLASVREGSR